MLRLLNRCAIRLHPTEFRRRFGDEMLSIFDHERGKSARVLLVVDTLLSLARQQILYSRLRTELPCSSMQSACDGTPSFFTLGPFRPRPSAVIHGLVLSITLFCTTCIAIRYSWIHVLHVRIPEVSFDSSIPLGPSLVGERDGRTPNSPPQQTSSSYEENALVSPHLQVDVMPVEAAIGSLAAAVKPGARGISVRNALPEETGKPIELRIDPFVGIYISSAPKVTILITIQDGSLVIDVDSEEKHVLTPVSTTIFSVEGTDDGRVEFVPDQDGKILRLQFVEAGRRLTAQRQ